jgi:hypothetical protein
MCYFICCAKYKFRNCCTGKFADYLRGIDELTYLVFDTNFITHYHYALIKIECEIEKKNVSRIRKKTFYLLFCMGTPEGNEFAG